MKASTSTSPSSSQPSRKSNGSARLILSILLLNGYASAQESSPFSSESSLEPRQLSSLTRPSIPITQSLPSTSSLFSELSSTFDSILDSLSSTADSLTSRTLKSSRLSPSTIQGLPGTSITSTEDFKSIQAYLDCVVGNGEWVYDSSGSFLAEEGKGLLVHKMDSKYASCDKRFYKANKDISEDEWNVRESLKYRFNPSSSCSSLLPTHLQSKKNDRKSLLPSRKRFCQFLAHKSLLLLGSTNQYSLHDLLLDYTTIEPQSCYGDLYCKEHALCGGILGHREEEEEEDIENWEIDQRVYHRLPLPPSSSTHSSSSFHLAGRSSVQRTRDSSLYPSSTYSTLLRYRRTDGLRPSTAQTLPSYQHPFTFLPEKNQQWLADSRRSDVVILEKQPIPLPLRSKNSTFDTWFYEYLEDEEVTVENRVERLMVAVKDVTERVWLPEFLESLKSIRSEPSPLDQLVIYRSGWRTHYDCAAMASEGEGEKWDSPGDGILPPFSKSPTLRQLIYRSRSRESPTESLLLQPLHVVYHNLQIVLQNYLSRTRILPKFGIVYLDLETPLSIWRSGLLGSSVVGKEVNGMRSSVGGDCSRYCFPSPGLALESSFVGGLERLFELSWAGNEEKKREWVGDEFKNLRLRLKEREEQ
ncbi:hypothetical protein JCM5350_006246 [Sporobolomyces pararoseus]